MEKPRLLSQGFLIESQYDDAFYFLASLVLV